jgi:patatin-like phospholipase/acyl hydrolase
MKNILCLDGGGVRGILPAMILEEIERRTGKPISESFDLITGVSTGSIIAIALTVPNNKNKPKYSASAVVKFYATRAKGIFKPRLKYPFYYMIKSKYRHTSLKDTIKDYAGMVEFTQLTNRVMIPCYDINERRPYFFKNWKISSRGLAAYEIATAACCAPIYFDPYILSTANGESEKAMIDGSVCSNNPTMCAYAEARRLWEDEEINVVSLGTGDISDPIKYKNQKYWGVLPWFNDVVQILIDAPTNTVDYQMKTICPDKYVRIHNKIKYANEELSDASSKNMKALMVEGRSLIASEDYKIEAIVEMIEKRDRFIKKQLETEQK